MPALAMIGPTLTPTSARIMVPNTASRTPVITLLSNDPIALARCTRRVAVASSVGLGALARPAPSESRPTLADKVPDSARLTSRSTSRLSTQRSTKNSTMSVATASGVPIRNLTTHATSSLPVVSSTQLQARSLSVQGSVVVSCHMGDQYCGPAGDAKSVHAADAQV